MKYVKTYEQLQDFYQKDNKCLITTQDEKWVALKNDGDGPRFLIFFNVDEVNDVNVDIFFQLSEERANDLLRYYVGMQDEFGYMEDGGLKTCYFYKVNDTNYENFRKILKEKRLYELNFVMGQNSRRKYLEDGVLTMMNDESEYKNLKVITYNIGAQREDNDLGL